MLPHETCTWDHAAQTKHGMALADYLASRYLSADQKPSKKRKRKDTAKLEGLTIADDDADDWTKSKGGQDDDDDAPTMVGSALSSGLNKPTKKAKWVKVGAAAPTDAEQLAADAILADAQAESRKREQQDDDAPAIVDEDGADYNGPTMASGALAGLQSAEQVTAALKRKERQERKAMQEAGLDPTGKAQETIYRDASGRVINVAMKRAEMRAKAEEEERKKQEELESRKGDVQRREKEERKRDLEDAKVMGVARYADDAKLNDELKEQERWNDPMAQLLATKKTSKSAKNKSSGKTYQGAFEPNRYGIRPGWRWDGVDRGNGFERKWFAARNKAQNKKDLEYHWEMDE
jgi:pre-mRNA-splicing factor CWC26